MKVAIGIVLIGLSMLSALSTASITMQAERAGVPERERFYTSLGSACFGLIMFIPGCYLCITGGKKRTTVESHRPRRRKRSKPNSKNETKRPDENELPRTASSDEKIALTCTACSAKFRVAVASGEQTVDCPKCGDEVTVTPRHERIQKSDD